MGHGTHEHLEEAEHMEHAAHDNFNRNVATTMAIIAATLAAASMLSHRSHTETLRLQTLANVRHTLASDNWSYYQAKNIRSHQYAMFSEMIDTLDTDPANVEQRQAMQKRWNGKVQKYETELPELETQARALVAEADEFQERSHHTHHMADRFDLGELGIEMGLVLASIAILTRRKRFWLAGIVAAGAGFLVALSAFLVH